MFIYIHMFKSTHDIQQLNPPFSVLTLPQARMAPENRPSQKERNRLPNTKCQGRTVRFRESTIWMFPRTGVPQNGWFIMENPIKNGWFGGENPLFSETSISWTKATGVVLLKFTFAWSIDLCRGQGVGGSEMKEIVQPARCGVMGCVRELQTTIETGAQMSLCCWLVWKCWLSSEMFLALVLTLIWVKLSKFASDWGLFWFGW